MDRQKRLRNLPLHLMLLPGVIAVILFSYVPMSGLVMAFEKFSPVKGVYGSDWIGLGNFKYLLTLPDTLQVLLNTVYIALFKIILTIIVPVVFALLLNEIGKKFYQRSIQTIVYLPHFLSWIILGGILIDILSPSQGIVNEGLKVIGLQPVFFLGDQNWFPSIMVITNTWKEFGFEAIVYIAALTSIDPALYEAAVIDGAGRWKQTWHVTLPGIIPIVAMITTLSMGSILNAGFDQIFNLYSPAVYHTGDILDTFIYRLGMLEAQYGVATAAGFFKSIVSFAFVATSYKLAYKYAGYRVF